jgi:hypothetical protein
MTRGVKTAKHGSTIVVEPTDTWACPCGERHSIDAYAAAHWTIELAHRCSCGVKRTLCNGNLDTPDREAGVV